MMTENSVRKDLIICPYIKTVKEYTELNGTQVTEAYFGFCKQDGCPYYFVSFEIGFESSLKGCCRRTEAEFGLGRD